MKQFEQRMSRYQDRPMWRWLVTLIPMVLIAYAIRHFTHSDHAAEIGGGVMVALNNSFEVVDWMMQEALDLLVTTPAIAANFNTDVQKEFERDFAPGETVRVKFPQEYLIRDGITYTPQPINRRHTTVSCTDIFGVDFDYDSFEKAVKMERSEAALRREYLEPAMAQMSQELENRAANWVRLNTSTLVGQLGTDPTTFDASSAAARQKLVELGCPAGGDRSMIVTPAIHRALKSSLVTGNNFNPVADVSKAIRTGVIGFSDNFDWYESVSLYQHTAGTWAGAVTVNGAGQSGTSLTITATAGDTFNQGDKFSMANVNPVNPRTRRRVGSAAKTFNIMQSLTAAGGGADVLQIWPPIYGPGSQYQNVDALPANSAALTLFPGTTSPNGKTGTINAALHRNAFAMVGVQFDLPTKSSQQIVRQLRDEETGIGISFIRWLEPRTLTWCNRFDTCIGFGNLYSDNCSVAVLGA